jgi:predicted RNA-binding Zn-ribbon protein involved in translation (DUF1610 family)
LWLASGLENKRFAAHIRRMTGRDYWTESLNCPKCGKTATVKFSQANGRAFHEGDQDIRVYLVPIGFSVVLTEFGNSFYCASCGTSADHK